MASESEICKDWLKEFPLLKRFKSGRKLLRLEGPIVLGIELEKFISKEYRPKFVALNLLSNFPVFGISRTLATKRLPQLSIAYSKHESAFLEAVAIMNDNFPFLSGPIINQLLVETYRSEIKLVLEEGASPLAVWFALIQLLKFFGQSGEAQTERAKLEDYVETLPSSSLSIYGDFNSLLSRELDAPTDKLERRRRINITKGGWDILPSA